MSFTESTETITGCNVRFMRGGKGAPLLFLHGSSGAARWAPFMEKLAESYEVIVPEHPGFGASDSPEWLDGMSDLAFFYLDVIDHLGLDKVNLVGGSIGGWLSAEIAIRNQTKLNSLTVVAPAGIRVKGLRKGDVFLWNAEETARNLFHDQTYAEQMLATPPSKEGLEIILKNRLTTAKLAWEPRFYNPDLHKWLHRISVPTLIVWGGDDKVVPAGYGPAWRDLIPDSRLEVIENCGHLPQVEKAERFVELVGGFIGGGYAMKFYFMHLMPYADLDLSYDEKHNSAWVTLPNTFFDPKKGHQLYNRYLDELEYADQLGFDGICVNEHHSNAYGLMPIPGVMAGALARRTKNVKIAILGRALPLLNNPLTVAEEFAMVDNITGGRLIAGMVRGIGAEYHSWGVNPAFSHERFQEAHDLILQAWTQPGPSVFEGKHYNFEYVNVWPRVYQDNPHPPIWIPSQGSSETIEWAAHPDRKYTYLQTFASVSTVARYMKMYKDVAAGYGYEATEDQLGWSLPLYVAETDEIARKEAKEHIEAFLQKFLRMPMEMLLPPGYTSVKSMVGALSAKAGHAMKQTIDSVIEEGKFICGSPATVREKLEEYQSQIGFGHLLTLLQFGTLPAELTRKNMEIYSKEVMPYLRNVTSRKAA